MATLRGPRGQETSVYWFARLIKSIGERDYILATEAAKRLRELGWIIHHRPRKARKAVTR
jgi:hypothetical protein